MSDPSLPQNAPVNFVVSGTLDAAVSILGGSWGGSIGGQAYANALIYVNGSFGSTLIGGPEGVCFGYGIPNLNLCTDFGMSNSHFSVPFTGKNGEVVSLNYGLTAKVEPISAGSAYPDAVGYGDIGATVDAAHTMTVNVDPTTLGESILSGSGHDYSTLATPEPSSALLLSAGLGALAGLGRRRKRESAVRLPTPPFRRGTTARTALAFRSPGRAGVKPSPFPQTVRCSAPTCELPRIAVLQVTSRSRFTSSIHLPSRSGRRSLRPSSTLRIMSATWGQRRYPTLTCLWRGPVFAGQTYLLAVSALDGFDGQLYTQSATDIYSGGASYYGIVAVPEPATAALVLVVSAPWASLFDAAVREGTRSDSAQASSRSRPRPRTLTPAGTRLS